MSNTPTSDEFPVNSQTFVEWLRRVAPYIHAFRGRTFVVAIEGEMVKQGFLNTLAQDLSLLHAMGMRIVLVCGSRPQVEEQLALRNIQPQFHKGWRVTDKAALECAMEASGELRLDIEAAFSQGLPNTPMAHSSMRIISGNFITARPMGILEGVDLQHTGLVRKIDVTAIAQSLNNNAIVLLSPLGFSPTGEAFNLTLEDVATSTARALKADKLIFVSSIDGVYDEDGVLIEELELDRARELMQSPHQDEQTKDYLECCVLAVQGGVERAHIVPLKLDGSVMLELFSHDGVGTMVSEQNLESLRQATFDDAGAIKTLIEPLEINGTLVRRGRDRIERDIEHFTVLEHDGILWGCAALYPYPDESMGELACLVVHPTWQGTGDGERLLKKVEMEARKMNLKRLFVLTTQTSHFFQKRGFVLSDLEKLPAERKRMYDWTRKSQILIKQL
ncbi:MULTISPECIES: amino-acid N-acetyltransferase [Limnobacter]|uniref:Amino-acid acetyltransferase n=1 Tax=Limnobacter litoralis TaxID=481366 RepID=A0ABQ5YRK6_9BURK|nr:MULTISPECIES: amino-acid N-acetyltransferase [Limnobacter]GLR26410.1 amino-acid acetyltransferase [Limnobacter litoralis]HEX5486227.1 amino-acid N-acetyltransferase [Limnobacter sp.]